MPMCNSPYCEHCNNSRKPEPSLSKEDRITNLIQDWIDTQGRDRCWYYPEIFRAIADELGMDLSQIPNEISREEFQAGCKRFQSEQYGGQSLEGMPKA